MEEEPTLEEKYLAKRLGLFMALTQTNPDNFMYDVFLECEEIIDKTIAFVESIKCSETTKILFVKQLKKALVDAKKQLNGLTSDGEI